MADADFHRSSTRSLESSGARPQTLAWQQWVRLLEQKRRQLRRVLPHSARRAPLAILVRSTAATFAMEGIAVDERDVAISLQRQRPHRMLRSRIAQSLRNHAAILHRIHRAALLGKSLTTSTIVRWYTSISSGLSIAALEHTALQRLDRVVVQLNSPQLRIQPALREIVRTHLDLLTDPPFHSFNGILSRLMLCYHLGHCGLPPIVVAPAAAGSHPSGAADLTLRLLVAVNEAYDELLTEK